MQDMSYMSVHVSSTDIKILFSSVWSIERTHKTLQSNSVTQVGILPSMKYETSEFIKCFQGHHFMWCSQQPCEVGMGLLPLMYLTGKKESRRVQWFAQRHTMSYETNYWPRCLCHPCSVTSSIVTVSWAPPSPTPPSLVNLHSVGPGHISVGGLKGKERALW